MKKKIFLQNSRQLFSEEEARGSGSFVRSKGEKSFCFGNVEKVVGGGRGGQSHSTQPNGREILEVPLKKVAEDRRRDDGDGENEDGVEQETPVSRSKEADENVTH